MEEWDLTTNDFVLRCNSSAGKQITTTRMSKSSVLHVKNTIVSSV